MRFFFLVFLFPFTYLWGQSDFEFNTCLNEVYFSNKQDGYIPISKDEGNGIYEAPQFVQKNELNCSSNEITTQYPIAYVSDSKITLMATFQTNCTKKQYIRGVGPTIETGQILFKKQKIKPKNGTLTYKWTTASTAFNSKFVMSFENFVIDWQISSNGTSNWESIGKSKNPLYITYQKPIESEYANNEWYHSLLKISCEASEGMEGDADIVSSIWSKVKSLSIVGADSGNQLSYYSSWTTKNTNTKNLLEFGDGQCRSWQHFLIDLFKVQGVSYLAQNEDAVFYSPAISTLGYQNGITMNWAPSNFLIKNWSVNTDNKFPLTSEAYEWGMIPKQKPGQPKEWFPLFVEGNKYNFHSGPAGIDIKGVSGQSNPNPLSYFGNHQIVKIKDGLFYDPSYGEQYKSIDEFEKKAVFGYGLIALTPHVNEKPTNEDFNGNGSIEEDSNVWLFFFSEKKDNFELEPLLSNY